MGAYEIFQKGARSMRELRILLLSGLENYLRKMQSDLGYVKLCNQPAKLVHFPGRRLKSANSYIRWLLQLWATRFDPTFDEAWKNESFRSKAHKFEQPRAAWQAQLAD